LAVTSNSVVIPRESGVSSTLRRPLSVALLAFTGSPAGACHRARRRRDPV